MQSCTNNSNLSHTIQRCFILILEWLKKQPTSLYVSMVLRYTVFSGKIPMWGKKRLTKISRPFFLLHTDYMNTNDMNDKMIWNADIGDRLYNVEFQKPLTYTLLDEGNEPTLTGRRRSLLFLDDCKNTSLCSSCGLVVSMIHIISTCYTYTYLATPWVSHGTSHLLFVQPMGKRWLFLAEMKQFATPALHKMLLFEISCDQTYSPFKASN